MLSALDIAGAIFANLHRLVVVDVRSSWHFKASGCSGTLHRDRLVMRLSGGHLEGRHDLTRAKLLQSRVERASVGCRAQLVQFVDRGTTA